jgi:formamidopyrimidine-DNA glycosylase
MPELPEVETIRKDLTKLIVGGKILGITTDSPKQVQPSPSLVEKAIVGASIKEVERRAKLLQIFLSNGKVIVIHLKLTGRVLVRKKTAPKDQHQRVTISLNEDRELRFVDLRKFGWVKVMTGGELEYVNREFGKEPLDDLDLKSFREILSSTRRPVKVLLMDQKKISGIGNIYACDALFLAGIHPSKKANSLSQRKQSKLFDAIEKVLTVGLKYRGASDQFYLDALGRKGSYQKHFLVYGRAGEKCNKCGKKIKKVKLSGRGTYFCPKCQKM